ncbi:YIP1 family protein [Catenovulum sediminis]|uniref:YIP1 family protein n=1 Tax=Catenovulum sediminis TaxID=1740262 RepID=A0ABV1RBZ9_9ALTE|nr:YIP1 family protein [Catenovulum sediminis]
MNNFFSLLHELIIRPRHGFTLIQNNSVPSWPAFLLIVLSLQLFWWLYFSQVDMQWLIQYTIDINLGQSTPAEKAQLAEQLTPEVIRYTSSFGSLLMLLLQGLLVASYLNIATKLDPENTDTFTNWFGFYWWIQLPVVLQLLFSTMLLLVTDASQTTLYELQITSLNQILALQPGDKFYSFAASFDLFGLWSFVLMFYGLSVKTQLKTSTLANICVIPLIAMITFSLVFS